MEPAVIYTTNDIKRWKKEGKSMEEIHAEVEENRKKVKEALNYHWDNPNNFFKNNRGIIAVTFLTSFDTLYLWSVFPCSIGIGSYDSIPSDIFDILKEASDGKFKCHECRKWFSKEHLKPFSYAGGVCEECYNPEIHLPPDSR